MIEPETGLLGRMLARKSVEQVQSETARSELPRTLGAANLVYAAVLGLTADGIEQPLRNIQHLDTGGFFDTILGVLLHTDGFGAKLVNRSTIRTALAGRCIAD